MAVAHLTIEKAGADRYQLVFESEKGRIVCDVAPDASSRGKTSEDDRREAALRRARMLCGAFREAIPIR